MVHDPVLGTASGGALVLLIRWIGQLPIGKSPGRKFEKRPLAILKERLARGEIEIDEYLEKKQLL